MEKRDLPELLAPAGSPEALEAAVCAGADAVYFGGAAFSNRMRARNFDTDELTEALQQTRRWGVKSYITVNTRVRDDEMGEVLALAEFLLRGGCSGFIVADMGIAAQLHSRFPDAPLHASTQMTLANGADARMMAEHGFTRMVVPREISQRELKRLAAESPLEIEMFIHGAYCVSVSGQCLMSWAMGGRSGNRGECAQPCRMVYRLDRGMGTEKRIPPRQNSRNPADYPLSLRDMCLAAHIPAILESGVASLKIEGRQKPAPYVYGVTKIYRTLLDEGRGAGPAEIEALDALFSRGGFTDGYFRSAEDKTAYSRMGGIRPTTEEQQNARTAQAARAERNGVPQPEALTKYSLSHRTRPCTGRLTLQAKTPAQLTMTDSTTGISVTVRGEIPQSAVGNPVTGPSLQKNLDKLGGTVFRWAEGQPETEIDEGLWYPVSAVNALRRNGAAALETALFPPVQVREGVPYARLAPKVECREGRRAPAIAVLYGRRQWIPEMEIFFETVYIPAEQWLGWTGEGGAPEMLGADLPPLAFEDRELELLIQRLERAGCRKVRFHSPGQLYLLRQTAMESCGSFRLNIWNSDALAWWYGAGADRVTVSPEMTLGGLRTLAKNGVPGGAIVYGHIPLMLTERCVLHCLPQNSEKTDSRKPAIPCGGLGGRMPVLNADRRLSCRRGGDGFCTGILTDRLGNRFPVRGQDGESVICNSIPLWMGDKADSLPPLTHREFLFTVESAEEIRQILRDTENGVARPGKRLK